MLSTTRTMLITEKRIDHALNRTFHGRVFEGIVLHRTLEERLGLRRNRKAMALLIEHNKGVSKG